MNNTIRYIFAFEDKIINHILEHKGDKKFPKEYNTIIENKTLKQFMKYVSLLKESKTNNDNFINECISNIKSLNFSSLLPLLPKNDKYVPTDVEQAIINVCEGKKDLGKYYEAYDLIKENLTKNKNKLNEAKNIQKEILVSSELCENERKLYAQLITESQEDKKNTFEQIKSYYISNITEGIKKSTSDEIKLGLYEAREEVMNLEYEPNTLTENLLKIKELNDRLNEELKDA